MEEKSSYRSRERKVSTEEGQKLKKKKTWSFTHSSKVISGGPNGKRDSKEERTTFLLGEKKKNREKKTTIQERSGPQERNTPSKIHKISHKIETKQGAFS